MTRSWTMINKSGDPFVPKWRQLAWYVVRIDRERRLGHEERVEAAGVALCRSIDAAVALRHADPYGLAAQAVEMARAEHQADEREPVLEPDPIDLDELLNGGGR